LVVISLPNDQGVPNLIPGSATGFLSSGDLFYRMHELVVSITVSFLNVLYYIVFKEDPCNLLITGQRRLSNLIRASICVLSKLPKPLTSR
jgi:hypothetical protein